MAEEHVTYRTAIGMANSDTILIRGYSLVDMMGNISLPGMFSLLVKGELPSVAEEKILEAILVSCAEHGVRPPSIQAAVQIASGGVQFQACVAGGILACGDSHGGAVENIMEIFEKAKKRMEEEGMSPEDMGRQILVDAKAAKRRLPGYGHPVHPIDPRTVRLMAMAKEYGVYGKVCAMAESMVGMTKDIMGRHLPLNVDGAVGALLTEMGFDWRVGKGVFLLGRVFGITAHVLEDKLREKPMSHQPAPGQWAYDGPAPRPFPVRK